MYTIKILALCVAGVPGYVADTCGNVLISSPIQGSQKVQNGSERILVTASRELHVREDIGYNDGVRIREYKQIIDSKLSGPVSWCAIFVSAVYTIAGYGRVVPNGCEWVPSWSKRCVIYSRNIRITNNELRPKPGDVVTFYYPLKKREAHVGIVKEWPVRGDYFYTIEGNTNRGGSRDGDGVYVKMRRKSDAFKIMNYKL